MTTARFSRVDRIKYGVKWVAAQTLYRLGLLGLWKHAILGNRAVVLTYHRVLPDQQNAATWSHPAIIVDRETFAAQMSALRRTFKVLSLNEFEQRLVGGAGFDAPSCLVTFDDGWRDTYTEAWPILKKYALPAVVFLPVRYIGSDDTFWQERLGHLVFEVLKQAQTDRALAEKAHAVLAEAQMADLLQLSPEQAGPAVIDRIRVAKTDARLDPARLVRSLTNLLGNSATSSVDRFMSWDEIREMAADGVSFGAHSETHRILTRLSDDEVAREAAVAKARIAEELHAEVGAFSYPNGDWNPRVASLVKDAEYRLAFSMDRGPVTAGDDRYAVRRVNIHADVSSSVPMFLARVLGVF